MSATYDTKFIGFSYNGDPATGRIQANAETSGATSRVVFRYDRASRTYELMTQDLATGQDRFQLFYTGEGDTDPAFTSDRFVGYSGDTFGPAGSSGVLRLYRYGSSNPELQLTYASFGHLTRRGPTGHLNFADYWFSYGIATKAADIPKFRTANYTGVLYGFAANPTAGTQYDLEGTSSFAVNFQTQRASGALSFTAVGSDASRLTVGTASFADLVIGAFQGVQSPFGGSMTGTGIENGSIEGLFYGPGAAEIAGHFAARLAIGSTSADFTAQGAFAAVKK